MTDLSDEFQQPGAAWRGKPFWSWNGELDEAELIRQIGVMKEMGLGGFFMHSRTGLVTEYLGEDWFRLTNLCADEAEKLGMEAWLYDEDRWPSGTAGGMVTENPEFRLHYLSLRPLPAAGFQWSDAVFAAFSCDLEELAFSDCRRLYQDTLAESYQGKTILVFTLEQMEPSSFYNGFTYVDTLNPKATAHYIDLTHEQYKAHCGNRLGQTIRGIFTDEPHRGAVMSGFSLSNENRLWMTPWTEALPALYQSQFGEDLLNLLPELFLQPDGEAVSPVKWRYMELTQQMFLDNFVRPLYDWCSANDMNLTGHALHEDSLTAQAAMQGSLMRFYQYLHCPGVDVLTEGNRNIAIVKQLASVARQLGQKWLLSELYGCTGWQMNFRSHKEVGDWQALFGINLRCHHLSWYTMEGEAKRDYPASILHQSAWWKEYDFVETYFARLGLVLSQGRPCCDILVLNPIESVWCQIHAGWAEGLTPKTQTVQELENAYSELSGWLLGAHLDFDYGDEEMLGRLSEIERDQSDTPRFCVGQASYKTVIVGRMTTLRASTVRLLAEFLESGGEVLFVGAPPAYVDAQPSSAPRELAAQAALLSWDKEEFLAACRSRAENSVEIVDATGQSLPEIVCQMRRDGERLYLAALNRSDTQAFQAQVRIHGQGFVEEWDCRTGERFAVPSENYAGCVEFAAVFFPSGERVYALTPSRDNALQPRPIPRADVQHICEGPFEFALLEENVCVLDFARFQLNDQLWQERREVLKVDQAVRRALEIPLRGGEMVQPWYQRKRQARPPVLTQVALAFDFDVDVLPIGPIYLCLERSEAWQVMLNDQLLDSKAQGWWVDAAFQKVRVPGSFLRLGRNELSLTTDFHEGTNIEAVYLIGGFGVRLEGNRAALTRLPERLRVGDLTMQGLPFYGGAVRYRIPVPPAAKPPFFVTTPKFEAACLKVQTAQGTSQMIAWPPYRAEISDSSQDDQIELNVALTRRNTFGPLHQKPLKAGAYGPGNFITEGEGFSEDYMLYPAGLLEAPVISWTALEEHK